MGLSTPRVSRVIRASIRTIATMIITALAVASLASPSSAADELTPTADPVVQSAQQAATGQLTTFTLNVCFCLDAAQAEADMAKAFTLGDVGGFQEFSGAEDRATLIRLATARDYGWYMPATGGGETIPIVWNRARFRLIAGQSIKVHDAIPDVTPARFINVVQLRELATGKVFGIINTHTIAQASFDAQLSNTQRIPYLQLHMKVLHDTIASLFAQTGYVFAMGDMNVNYLADRVRQKPGLPTAALGDLVNFDMPLTGSRGATSLLDYGMTVKEGSGFQLTGSRVEYGFNSDHDAVVFDYGVRDFFSTGAVFNRPTGDSADQGEVTARAVRAINSAEAGAQVRLVAAAFDEADVAGALLAAQARGVSVQVILPSTASSGAVQTLVNNLGLDVGQPSWAKQCSASCLGGSGKLDLNLVLVSRAGGSSNVSFALNGTPQAATGKQWTDGFLATDADVYNGFNQTFEQMALDAVDTRRSRQVNWGSSYSAQLYPIPEGIKDPMLKNIKRIRCRNSKGAIRVTVSRWAGPRGQELATRLARLDHQGCDVRAVLGNKVAKKVQKILLAGNVRIEQRPVDQNVLYLKGRFGKAHVNRAWVGGPDWTPKGLVSDGVTLVVDDGAAKAYLRQFYRVFKNK